jgi:cutinase
MLGPNKITIQGLDYPADYAVSLFFYPLPPTSSCSHRQCLGGQGACGAPTLALLIRKTKGACPKTKLVVSGFSQGALVVHQTFDTEGILAGTVNGAVMYGDMFAGFSMPGIPDNAVKNICIKGDEVNLSS